MRVAVTGVTGFVGVHLAPALAAAGHEVIGLGHAATAGHRTEMRAVPGLEAWDHCDVTIREDVRGALERWRPEAVVHLAAQSSGALSFADPSGTFAVNATGTLHVLEAARERASRDGHAPRVLLVGTSEIYAEPDPPRPVAEDAPLGPRNPYGASKAAADLLGRQYAVTWGLPVVRTRSFAHAGPGQSATFALPAFASQIAEAERRGRPGVVTTGNLDVVRDYLDVRDVVRAYVLLLERGRAGEAYNVCSGTGRRLGDLLDTLIARAAVPITVERSAARLRPVDLAYLVGDPGKVQRETGWRPEVPIGDSLAEMLEWWRGQSEPTPAEVRQ